jgi:tRNA G18 (ribose-2'-O)-methylase SpoU
MLLFDTIQSLPLTEKRALVKSLKDLIKNDVLLSKVNKQSLKQAKEIEKKQKIEAQIKAAQDKLIKLQAKLV